MSLRRYLRRWQRDRETADELRAHLDLAEQFYIDRGMSPEHARRHARLRLGNPRAHQERVDDMQRLPVFDALRSDLRLAIRRLRQAPGFSATVILTLAVTIGAAGAVFSLADAILLRPLNFPQPDRLAVLSFKRVSPSGEYVGPSVDGAMWAAASDHTPIIDAAVSFRGAQGVNAVLGSTPTFVRNQVVGAGYFRVLGVSPQYGREFLVEEARAGGPSVVMLSHEFWQRAFGGRPDTIGQTLLLRGEPFTIVGIMPSGFRGLVEADVWTPLRSVGQGLNYMAIARPRDGVSMEAANAQLAALGVEPFTMLRPPAEGVTRTLTLRGLQDTLVAGAREPIVMLGWGAGAVLLIACVNIMALLLARGSTRAKEIATRMALGSGRRAVVRQLMVESLVLALVGGALGLLVGYLGLEGLKTVGANTYAEWSDASLDLRTAGITFVTAAITSVLFGLVPAWQASRVDLQHALLAGGSRSIAGSSRHAIRRLLVVAEVALGVVVLVSAGLLFKQFTALYQLDPGFSPQQLYTVNASLQDARYKDPANVNRLFSDSIDRLRRTPGIQAAAVSQGLPYERLLNMAFSIEGRPDNDQQPPIANIGYVTPGFFETFGVTRLSGRVFSDQDTAVSPRVAVVNDAFARHYFPGENTVGRRMLFGTTAIEIVGVTHDVQQGGAGFFLTGMQRGPVSTSPTIYVPAAQTEADLFAWFSPAWTVRASGARDAASAFRDAIAAADPMLPITETRVMEDIVAESLAQPRLMMTLVGALALTGLLLAAIGIHGLVAQAVTERTREFGIRMALGASARQIVSAIAGSGVALAVLGGGVGAALSVPATATIESFLYTVAATDPMTYVIVVGLLVLVAIIASIGPAMAILRLDPVRTLRD